MYLFIALLISNFVFSNNLDIEINKYLKKNKIDKKDVSIVFYDLENKEFKYKLNDNNFYSIASVSKIFTAGFILDQVDEGFRFKTPVYIDGVLKNSILNGNIYIKGSGDPLFVTENMWILVNKIASFGIKEIKGDIIIDNTFFKTLTPYENGNDRAYSSKISPMTLNFNSIAINIISGPNAKVTIDPDVNFITVEDKTIKSKKPTEVSLNRSGKKIIVKGNINVEKTDYKVLYRNIDDPERYFTTVLVDYLGKRGVVFNGKTLFKKVENKNLIFELESKRIDTIIKDMNRYSNNFIAEQLMASYCKTKVFDCFNEYLKKLSLDTSGFNLENGSGFSYDNKVKTSFVISFLEKMKNSDKKYPFISSLAVSGEDGTLASLIKDKRLKGRIRAKTGSLTGVRALAGYLDDNTAFMIVVNNLKDSRIIEEDIIKMFLGYL